MAVTIVLGKKPKAFKKFPVKFLTPEGEKAAIMITFKYRSKDEFSPWFQALVAGEAYEPDDGEQFDFVKMFAHKMGKLVEAMLDSIIDWDLDFELNKENLTQLGNEYQASLPAFLAAYQNACNDGKLGN